MKLCKDKKFFLIICICIIILSCITTVYADSEYKSQELETIDNGTVSGGLYSDSYLGYDTKGTGNKRKNRQIGLHEIKTNCASKVKRIKRQHTER